MSRMILYLSNCIISVILLISCTTISETIYLQNAEVDAPLTQPPLHIYDGNDSSTVTFSPKIIINKNTVIRGNVLGHTNVNSQGIFQLDSLENNTYPYTGQNLTWSPSDIILGFDFDARLGKNTALFFGLNFSSKNRTSQVGGLFGIGIFGYGKSSTFRIDGGLMFQSVSNNLEKVIVRETDFAFGGEDTDITFFEGTEKFTSWDPFVSFTFNTFNNDWLINFLLSFSYHSLSIVEEGEGFSHSHTPWGTLNNQDKNIGSTARFFQVTPGIYFRISESSKIILATKFSYEVQIANSNKTNFIMPMVQIDFTLP